MVRFQQRLMLVFLVSLCSAGLAEGQDRQKADFAFEKGMEWKGSYASTSVGPTRKKPPKIHVNVCHLRITGVNEGTITGNFAWETEDETKVVRFKGTVGRNHQFQFPITDVVKGSFGPKILNAALSGSFSADGKAVGGSFVKAGGVQLGIGEFKGQLVKAKPDGEKGKHKK